MTLCGPFKQIKSKNLGNKGVIPSPHTPGPYNIGNLLWNNKQKIIILKGQFQDAPKPHSGYTSMDHQNLQVCN